MKQFGNSPFLGVPPPFQLTPLFPSNLFMTPSLSKFQKRDTPPPLILGGEETMKQDHTNEIMKIGSKEIKVASFFKLGFTLCKAE